MIAAKRTLSWQRPYTAIEGVRLKDVAAAESLKRTIANEVLGSKPGARPVRLMLCGLPGNGKTMLARAIANELGAAMFVFTPAEVTVRMHNSPEYLRDLFEAARCYENAVILMEDADQSLGSPKCRALLRELQRQLRIPAEPECRIVFITTTSKPWKMPADLLRLAGRRIFMPMPGAKLRKAILTQSLSELTHPSSATLTAAAWMTKGFTCSETAQIAPAAAREAIHRAVSNNRLNENITTRDILKAIREIHPRTSKQSTRQMNRFARRRQVKGSQGNHSPERGIQGGGAPWQVWTESNTAPAA